MPEKIDLICITCPKGCTLHITREGDTILDVDAGCKRGHHTPKKNCATRAA